MTRTAWYIGCADEDIAARVILVGDPGRIPRIGKHLDSPREFPVNRGLAIVTGRYAGVPVTAASFGMGAPIAAIVMHELADLGAHTFVRIGTCIGVEPAHIGDLVISDTALCLDGTSAAYAQDLAQVRADPALVAILTQVAATNERQVRVGRYASYDAFYRDMFSLDAPTQARVESNVRKMVESEVIAIDMETSAVLTVGRALECRSASFCLASVNGLTHEKIARDELLAAEAEMTRTALEALVAIESP